MNAGHPVIAIAGRIEAGKSSVARRLSLRLGMPVLSFGAFIRSVCPPEARREDLQVAGARMLEEIGPCGLIDAVLAWRELDLSTPAIWEGVRHLSVLGALRTRYDPVAVELFFLSPPEHLRRVRVEQRAGSSGRRLDWEAHETEATDALEGAARLVITAHTPEDAAKAILAELGEEHAAHS